MKTKLGSGHGWWLAWLLAGSAQGGALGIHPEVNGELELAFALPPRTVAVLEASPDLADWEARYAFETGAGHGVVHYLPESACGFFRVRSISFPTRGGLMWIPPGTFLMGSPATEFGHEADEGPVHSVHIDKGFWMGMTEVTVRDYVRLIGVNPTNEPNDSDVAVHQVSLAEAEAYCRRLTEEHRRRGWLPPGTEYRLPSEAEWEYACRAGSQTRFSYGDDAGYEQLPNYAWCRLNSAKPMPVARKLPNAWGLYDMHGNVFEWCLGFYTPYPGGHRAGYNKIRNYRGGSFYCPLAYLRSASRHPGLEDGSDLIGFRVVLGAPAETVLPLNQVAAPEFTVEWAADGTWARVVARCATPEAEVRYSTDGQRPLLGSPLEPPVLTAAATVKAAGFRTDWTRSPIVELRVEQLPPPEATIEAGFLRVLEPAVGRVEYALAPDAWVWLADPVPVPPGTQVHVRARQEGFLTSATLLLTAPAE